MILVLSILFSSALAQEMEPTVTVKSMVTVDSDNVVSLADIAEMQNTNAVISEMAKEFKLCNAPSVGERRTFTARAMSELLRSFQGALDRKQLRVRFILPHSVVVERSKTALSAENVRDMLLSKWSKLCVDCRLVISDLRLPAYADGDFTNWTLQVKDQLPKGSFSVPLRISRATIKEPEIFWLQGRLDVLRLVPVANRAIYFGEKLAATDFRSEYREVTFAHDSPPAASELIGLRIRSPLRVNDVIWRNSVEKEKALSRGSPVRVRFSDGEFNVSLDAKAEQDGNVGDVVTVRNMKSQKTLPATVTGRGEVMVQ